MFSRLFDSGSRTFPNMDDTVNGIAYAFRGLIHPFVVDPSGRVIENPSELGEESVGVSFLNEALISVF